MVYKLSISIEKVRLKLPLLLGIKMVQHYCFDYDKSIIETAQLPVIIIIEAYF